MPGDEVFGDEPAQPAGAAGDQHGAVRVRAGGQLTGGHRQRREPGREQPAGAYRELRLGTGGEGRAQPGRVRAVDVDQDEPARILLLGGPDQTPEGRVHRPGHVLTVAGGDRAGRHQDQPRPAEPVVGEPPLDQVQRPGGSRDRRVRQGPPGQHDGLRRVPGPLDVGRERGQVRVVGHPEAEVAVAVAEHHRPVGGPGLPGRHRHPVELVQRRAVGGPRHTELVGRERPDHQRGDRGDRGTAGVGQLEGDLLRTGPGQPDPQRRGTGGVQGDAGPGERHLKPTVVGLVPLGQVEGVQRGVEQRRVQAEPRGRARRPRAAPTSAYTSSPRCQAARRPWNSGP